MRIVRLDSGLEPLFWKHVTQDIPNYYFPILRLKRQREFTEIVLALDEENRIEGLMMIYRSVAVQLRGSVDAAKALLERLNLDKVDIQGEIEHKETILAKFEHVRKASEIILMTLRRGEENLQIRHTTEVPTPEDAEEIADLMRRGSPDWWGDTTAERIATRMEQLLWLGTKDNGRLISVGGATVDDWAGNIAPVVTHEDYRKRGYATSVVSALVQQIFQKSNLCLIHVESDNEPAIRAYTKVGFKPYKRYFFARAER